MTSAAREVLVRAVARRHGAVPFTLFVVVEAGISMVEPSRRDNVWNQIHGSEGTSH